MIYWFVASAAIRSGLMAMSTKVNWREKMSKLEDMQNKAVLAMFDTQINTIEDLLSDIADCEYQTRSQVVAHIYKELERVKAIKDKFKESNDE